MLRAPSFRIVEPRTDPSRAFSEGLDHLAATLLPAGLAVALLVLVLYGAPAALAQGASFEILEVQTLDKATELEGVQWDPLSGLSKRQWNRLPVLVEVKFEFEPAGGNRPDSGDDTFVLVPGDMALRVGGKKYPAIGALSGFGEGELRQQYPYNVAPGTAEDGSLEYCDIGCPSSTMWFLVPEETTDFTLTYRGQPVAEGAVEAPGNNGENG